MFVCIVVCACSRHVLDFNIFFSQLCEKKGLLRDLFHVGAGQNYCESHLSSRRSDCGLTMQVSCLEDKPNLRTVEKGDTPEVVGWHLSIISIYDSKSQAHAVVYSA